MTEYYVDPENGDDANNGLSGSSPFKWGPGSTNATGNALAMASLLAPGDRVLYKRGTTAVYPVGHYLRFSRSGTPDNRITWDGAGWGIGDRCKITNQNVQSVTIWGGSNRHHLNILNFHFFEIGGYKDDDPIWDTLLPEVKSPPGGGGLACNGGSTYWLIDNCKFEKIGQWKTTKPMSGTLSMTGSGIGMESVGWIKVNNCEFTKMRVGIAAQASGARYRINDIEISNCNIHHHIVWGIDVSPRSAGVTLENILIRDTNIFNYSQCDSGNWTGYGDKPHRDGIFFRTSAMASSKWINVRVTRCRFWDDEPGNSNGGTASIFISQAPSVTIDNCVFLNERHSGIIYYGGGKPSGTGFCEIRLLNNTIIGGVRAIRSASQGYINSVDRLVLRNNVLIRNSSNNLSDVININRWTEYRSANATTGTPERLSVLGLVGEIIDENNLIFTLSPTLETAGVYSTDYPKPDFRGVGTSWRTLDQWRELTGAGATNRLGNPLLMSMSGLPSTWDVRPGTGSYAIENGADLSGYGVTTDIAGTTKTFPYDIGAYEVSADAPDDTAPTFTLQPASQTLAPGSSVTFTAAATGYPAPTYQWRKGSVNIAGATASSYTIPFVQEGDEGNYTVVATNSSGSVISTPAALSVIDVAPVVRLKPRPTQSRLRAALN